VQNYKKGIIRARKKQKKFPFWQKNFSRKIKKFSKTFYNLLIFSISFYRIEEKVFQNEIQTDKTNRHSANYGTIIVLITLLPYLYIYKALSPLHTITTTQLCRDGSNRIPDF